jgi:GYF domain 2
MNYMVKRGEESFGPYTLTDLQKYLQEGRVLPGDLAQSEGMTEWVPVSQIVGNIPLPALAPAGAAVPAQPLVPLPPNLHWVLLLLLNLITRQFFNWIWAFVLANWARKLSGSNKPMVLVAMYPAGFMAAIFAGAVTAALGIGKDMALWFVILFVLGGAIAYLFGIFKIRDAMEEYYNSRENIALTLSGVMTFFFSSIYLQYHVNRIARWKKTGILS